MPCLRRDRFDVLAEALAQEGRAVPEGVAVKRQLHVARSSAQISPFWRGLIEVSLLRAPYRDQACRVQKRTTCVLPASSPTGACGRRRWRRTAAGHERLARGPTRLRPIESPLEKVSRIASTIRTWLAEALRRTSKLRRIPPRPDSREAGGDAASRALRVVGCGPWQHSGHPAKCSA